MVLGARNFYVVKQADGTLWNFTYKDNFGIIYRTFDENSWSNYNVLVKDASNAFSALILPDNRICIIYQSSSGNLLLKVYSGNEWMEYSILHKKGNSATDIHFKTMYALEKIQIFYSILQSHDNIRTLFHQTLTLSNELKVSSPVFIDTTNVNHVNQFVVHELGDNTICIMYQKLLNKYELGYKIFDDKSENWSKFYNVDKNISPYTDYSLCSGNDKLNILYIKNNGISNALYNSKGDISKLEHIKIAESNNLISCALFKESDITYGFWISNNYLYSYYFNEMSDSVSSIKSESLKSMNILKSSFIEISSDGQWISNELFIQDEITLTILPNNFFIYKENLKEEQNKLTSKVTSEESPYGNTEEIVISNEMSEMRLIKKDQVINQLNYILKEEKNKILLLSNKINLLEKDYLQLENQKSQLDKDTSSLWETLISKENRIHELEKSLVEKDTKLMDLNKLNSKSEEKNIKNLAMEPLIEEYKIAITNSNKFIEGLNSKISNLEEEKVALINDITNSSLFKRFFN